MDRHAGIVAVASVVIAASVGYSAFSVLTLDELQIKWNDRGSFDFMTMLNGGVIEVCSSSSIPLRFSGITIETFYNGEAVGRFVTGGATVQPGSAQELDGRGEMTSMAGSIFSMFVDTEMSGTDIARIDADAMTVRTGIDAVVLGLIPYTVSKEYAGQEFFDAMNGGAEGYGC